MNISIIIVNYNTTKYIANLLKSIHEFINELQYEIIIVDNCSPEKDIIKLAEDNKDVKFIFLSKNYGFGYANNRGIEVAQSDYCLLLNPDTFLTDSSIINMFKTIHDNKDWGIVGPMVMYSNGNIQESALHFPNIRYEIS
ncbi:MAG: glycosyltransferase, partial [Melioribacteraceae bacterium]|nr:glycosyltransferase [Melioribacteraceae bacterium]